MAKKRITSRPGLLGNTGVDSDESGRYVGKSRPGFFGSSYTTLEVEDKATQEEIQRFLIPAKEEGYKEAVINYNLI